MSDVNDWLKERRVYADCSPGHWIRSGHDIYCRDDGKEIGEWAYLSDAEAIVDAHNTLPALLTAVGKVLELHARGKDGKCVECFHMYHGDWYAYRVDYPCPTVRAIEGAIK